MSRFSLKIFFFSLALIGLACLPFLSYKLIPENNNQSLQISFLWPNASQYAMETEITSKYEAAFFTLSGIKHIHSKSYPEYGEIYVQYDESTDIEKERFKISSLIRQIYPGLPKEVSYPKISFLRHRDNDIRLLSYSIIVKDDSKDIQKFISGILTPQITKNEDVNSIKFNGIPEQYYELKYNRSHLDGLKISENDIRRALQDLLSAQNLGAVIDKGSSDIQEYTVTLNTTQDKEYLYNLPLKRIDTKLIRLKDVASIEKKNNSKISLFRINGINTIGFSVIADKSSNHLLLANSIKNTINDLNGKYPQYDFFLTSDSTKYLKSELVDIFLRFVLSFTFLLFFTVIIYRNVNYVLSLFTTLIITFLISIIFFKILKIDVHIYSLMAISISVGLVMDNSIITIDHFLRKRNKKIIVPILAATLTSIAPLLFITFLDDSIRANLDEFSWSLIIILISSLVVSFFFIPAIINKTKQKHKKRKTKSIKKLIFYNQFYLNIIIIFRKYRVIISLIIILLFGLPLFLLPKTIEGNSIVAKLYNKTLGSEYYVTKLRPNTDKYLGGALKLFAENSLDQNFIENPKRLAVSLRINTPFGSTIEYIDTVCNEFEKVLQKNQELGIDFFQTEIYGKRAAQIDVYFVQEKEATDFPFEVKGFLEKETLKMSGVNFSVFGIGRPFSTSSGESFDSNILLKGYDYKKLYQYAEFAKIKLEENSRIDNVYIRSESSWFDLTSKNYTVKANSNKTADVLSNIRENFSSTEIGFYEIEKKPTLLKLVSDLNSNSYKILNTQFHINDSTIFKPKFNLKFDLVDAPDKIVKSNQEYQLTLQYQFKGTYKHSELVREQMVTDFSPSLMAGFKIEDGNPKSNRIEKDQLYIPLIICLFIIFSICSILLESFKKSLVIIIIVPVTFIGLFFSLYTLEIGLNYGVYAGLILLVGLLVNSSIYITNEYAIYNKRYDRNKSYIKAFNKKILPVIITIISTIIGLIPFLISDVVNNFWYPFAITVSIGLAFSIFTLFFILPIFLISEKKHD